MVTRGPNNIFGESYPLFFVTGLVGLRPFRICGTTIFGYIYVVIISSAYCALYCYTISETIDFFEKMKVYSRIARLRTIQATTGLFFVALMIIPSVARSSEIRRLYAELESVDEKLKLLNVKFDYGRAMRRDIVHLLEITMYTVLVDLIDYFPLVGPETPGFFDLVWLVNCLPEFVNSVAVASFVVVIAKVRRRLEAVNEFIPNLMTVEKNVVVGGLEVEMNNVFRLRLLNRIREKLIGAATTLNETHGLVLLTSFVAYFLTACVRTRTIYSTAGDKPQIVDFVAEFLWLLFGLGKCLYVVDACHGVAVQVKQTGHLLNDKLTETDHHPLRQEADAMARRVESRSLQLTACNLFVIDYSTLRVIIIALAVHVFFVANFSNVSTATQNKKM